MTFNIRFEFTPEFINREVKTCWVNHVNKQVLFEPMDRRLLHDLVCLEDEIRMDARLKGETRDHVEAVLLICGYKLQIMDTLGIS